MTDRGPSRFYTGLVAELYEPLVSERARAEDYVPFLERSGTPALELGCGTGLPLIDLLERGFDVEGLDASEDMLARCGAAAAARGVDATLHRGDMQSFSLQRRYRSILLAGRRSRCSPPTPTRPRHSRASTRTCCPAARC